MKDKQVIKFIDRISGEIFDLTYSTVAEAESLYLEINAMVKSLTLAKSKLLSFIGDRVDDRYDFGDGYKGMWVPRSMKKYRPEIVRKYLDDDQMALVTVIDGRKLKDLLEQLIEDGHGIPGAWADIDGHAEVKMGKPSFQIRKGM